MSRWRGVTTFVVTNPIHEPMHRAFAPVFVVVGRFRGGLLEIGIVLVDGIIGEMHAYILYVLFGGFHIDFSAHTHQPVVEEIHTQRLHRANHDVNTQIKFESIE